ncbi:ABC transporter ATP-binding protein [Lysobacter enzymogenes]|uniref:ABC transporter ATP-binding protein n=1 Tax=Lysobacter enzymogenes TaxID=69 RepID=UPI00089BACC5|nr:ABC transporter ATP-binding protein [Lysobacter enzymogenes]SDW34936.1 ABC-type polysaccharide/polyol phosphate transport system, ATPase component [Lysobacter enzymogenes]
MSIYLKASEVALELPLDTQRVDGIESVGLRASLSGSTRRYVTVLSGISLNAVAGTRIALLGLNGAGKTTLLRVLNGVYPPTRGSVAHSGTLQSLLNSTLGFAEHASLIENVLLRGTAMGLSRRELRSAMGDILEFAGLRDRVANRLGSLSAGQRMRLGFAISTCAQPDILLMDEWIATGDAAFLQRAQERMLGRVEGARIVVLASHNSELLRRVCDTALVLDRGRMRYFGSIEEGLSVYRELVSAAQPDLRQCALAQDPLLFGDVRGYIERIRLQERSIEVEGWAIGEREREAENLWVELDGRHSKLDAFERVMREDVVRATARRSGRFGFRFRLPAQWPQDPSDIAVRLRVSVGNARHPIGHPLHMATGSVVEAA